MQRLQPYLPKLTRLCEQHKVKILYAFGSVLTSHFNDNSDIDLLVTFNNMPLESYADNYFDFKFALQDMFHRPVDLLESQALTNPYLRKKINQEKQVVYG